MKCTQDPCSRKQPTYCSVLCRTSTYTEQLSSEPAKHARKGGLEGRGWFTHYINTRRVCGRTGKDATSHCKLPQTKSQAELRLGISQAQKPETCPVYNKPWAQKLLPKHYFILLSLWSQLYFCVTWLLKFQTMYHLARGSKHLKFFSWSDNGLVTFLKTELKLNKGNGYLSLCLCKMTHIEHWQFNHKIGHFKSCPSYVTSCGIPAQWSTLSKAEETQKGLVLEAFGFHAAMFWKATKEMWK